MYNCTPETQALTCEQLDGYHDLRKSFRLCRDCGLKAYWIPIEGTEGDGKWVLGDNPVSMYESGRSVIQDVRIARSGGVIRCGTPRRGVAPTPATRR